MGAATVLGCVRVCQCMDAIACKSGRARRLRIGAGYGGVKGAAAGDVPWMPPLSQATLLRGTALLVQGESSSRSWRMRLSAATHMWVRVDGRGRAMRRPARVRNAHMVVVGMCQVQAVL